MPKTLMAIPDRVRKGATLNLGKIPVNTYSRSVTEELASGSGVTVETCLRVYRDMAAMRLKQRLHWDPVKEKFAGPNADAANARHSRPMRAPWSLKEA